ncbi:hypothetical protein C8R44DRAFT_871730 [Mycena epipterygia]|nr:hypothetical protein C8R44DRAFT_871730 [Mycena epipterygia]
MGEDNALPFEDNATRLYPVKSVVFPMKISTALFLGRHPPTPGLAPHAIPLQRRREKNRLRATLRSTSLAMGVRTRPPCVPIPIRANIPQIRAPRSTMPTGPSARQPPNPPTMPLQRGRKLARKGLPASDLRQHPYGTRCISPHHARPHASTPHAPVTMHPRFPMKLHTRLRTPAHAPVVDV